VIFSSPEFLFLFLPAALVGTVLSRRISQSHALLWLGLTSAAFYSWWHLPSLILLVASIIFNYLAGERIRTARNEKTAAGYLAFSVTVDLLVLAYFKYAGFALSIISSAIGTSLQFDTPALPLGISFFTFTQIAYLVDMRRSGAATSNFPSYWLFVTYFPHLIAGPVLHHAQFMPQFQRGRAFTITRASLAIGLSLLTIGLAKKTLLADPLGAYASAVFDDAAAGATPLLVESWIGALCYTFQLYFDFSGYSDMALGISRVVNLRLPANFLSPYKATSIIDFWRRWHVSLSSFLRDYLYVPLGGNRKGPWRTRINMFLTMLLGGLWHGAGWTFVLWGAFHGALLVLNHTWRNLAGSQGAAAQSSARVARMGGGVLTFILVLLGWTLFRSADLDTALRMLRGLCGLNGVSLPPALAPYIPEAVSRMVNLGQEGLFAGAGALRNMGINRLLLLLPVASAIVWWMPNTAEIFRRRSVVSLVPTLTPSRALRWRPSLTQSLMVGSLLALAIMAIHARSEFLYFQF
jgi:alginate O-acetyltransferase complex protein AlgI